MLTTITHLTGPERAIAFTVHERPDPARDRLDRAEGLVFVKDGFSWGAFLLGPLWLIGNGLWLALIGYLVLVGAVTAGLDAIEVSDTWISLAILAIHVALGYEADTLQRTALARRGWQSIGSVTGRSRSDCERRFFDGWLAAEAVRAPRDTPEVAATAAAAEPTRRRWRLFRRGQ